MKRLFLFSPLFVLIGFVFTSAAGLAPDRVASVVQAEDADQVAKVITSLSRQWANVPVSKDTDFLKRTWAADFAYIMSDGTVLDRKGGLAFFEDDPDTYSSAVNVNFKVRVYDKDFAVATGDFHTAGKDKEGKSFIRKSRFTNVWVRQEGGWKVVAGHASDLE